MRCFGCNRMLEVGDQYIQSTPSDFLGKPESAELDGLVAEIAGSGVPGKVVFCEDCTVDDGGRYLYDTVYGDEEAA